MAMFQYVHPGLRDVANVVMINISYQAPIAAHLVTNSLAERAQEGENGQAERKEEARLAMEDSKQWDYASYETVAHLSQLSISNHVQAEFCLHYAFDHNNNVWRRWFINHWKEARDREVILDISSWLTQFFDGATQAEHKAWLTLANFKAIEELCKGDLGADFDTNPSILGLIGYHLDTSDGFFYVSGKEHRIAKRLSDDILAR